MHAFSKDGKHLVIHDGFGLSRITFPKSVKTDKSLAGRDMSLAANRLLVSASKSHQRALRTVDALLNLRFSGNNYDAYALYPDDRHAVQPAFRTLRVIDTSAKDVAATLEFAADTLPFVATRIKMAEDSEVLALVEAGGRWFVASRQVKVTVGGCGG